MNYPNISSVNPSRSANWSLPPSTTAKPQVLNSSDDGGSSVATMERTTPEELSTRDYAGTLNKMGGANNIVPFQKTSGDTASQEVEAVTNSEKVAGEDYVSLNKEGEAVEKKVNERPSLAYPSAGLKFSEQSV